MGIGEPWALRREAYAGGIIAEEGWPGAGVKRVRGGSAEHHDSMRRPWCRVRARGGLGHSRPEPHAALQGVQDAGVHALSPWLCPSPGIEPGANPPTCVMWLWPASTPVCQGAMRIDETQDSPPCRVSTLRTLLHVACGLPLQASHC